MVNMNDLKIAVLLINTFIGKYGLHAIYVTFIFTYICLYRAIHIYNTIFKEVESFVIPPAVQECKG
jgi:hypothetical protein